ncbi:hypothetical protein J7L49_02830 [Candidatus Bathyarchaeota archaeon]|nr:hypothetical protein [Candidatus Bathyarchaeota archaeon]
MNKKHKILLIVISAFLLFFPNLYFSQLLNVPFLNIATSENTSTTTIFVDPSNSTAPTGENFTVYVNVSNVVDLYGWEFKLSWNTTILNLVNVVEGSFLKSDGASTFFTYKLNSTAGYTIVDDTRLGNISGVNGSGALALITFYVKNAGHSILDLYDTILINSFEQTIEHSTVDGYFYSSIVHDIAVLKVTASYTYVNVTVQNQGTVTETSNITLNYTLLTDPLLGVKTITLKPNSTLIVTFSWDPCFYAVYEIQATASIVQGENDTVDNILIIRFYAGRPPNAGFQHLILR